MYGVEASSPANGSGNAGTTTPQIVNKDPDSNSCVICLDEPRSTTILPCLHMCLCYECAAELRKTSANCPLCREPVSEFWCIKGSHHAE